MAINDTDDISQAEADRIYPLLKSALKDNAPAIDRLTQYGLPY